MRQHGLGAATGSSVTNGSNDQLGRPRPTVGNSSAIFAPTSRSAEAGRIITLRLLPDSTAVLETDFAGREPVPSVRGRWMLSSDTVVAMHPSDGAQKPLLWRPRGGSLLPLAWDTTRYGQRGLPLTRRY